MNRPAVSDLLRAMPPESAALTRALLDAANERGLAVHLVGGPVRDWLLERPLRDVDLILEPGSTPAGELARVAAPEGARISAHDRFGTVVLQVGSAVVDVATARRERYEHDGALPTVEPAPIEEDLLRRDFSVNALAIPLSRAARSKHSEIVDPTGGLLDLERRHLRILHRRSFCDDPTRVLRDPARALRLLSDWHVLGSLEPGLDLNPSVVPVIRRVGRAVATPPWRSLRWRPWETGLAVWLAPNPPQLRRRTLQRFAVRGAQAERIVRAPTLRDRTLRALGRARGRGAIDAVLRDLGEEELHAVYAWASPALRRRIARYAEEDRHRRLPVNGADLEGLGLEGPAIGRALERIRLGVLDGAVGSREEALTLALEVGRRRTPTPSGSRRG
jgi:tRNA nucleotidyltransferase (CCA-adding enzyme)